MTDKEKALMIECPLCKTNFYSAKKRFSETRDIEKREHQMFCQVMCKCGWNHTFKIELLDE